MRHLHRQRTIGVQREAGAFEHEFILAAGLGAEDERQAGFRHTLAGQGDAVGVLVYLERAGVDRQQQFGAAFGQGFRHCRQPPVLADQHTQTDAPEGHRARGGAGIEHPLVIEHAVVRQLMFGAPGQDAAGFQHEGGVVEFGAILPRSADDQAGAAIGGVGGQGLDGGRAARDEGGLAHQVFRRIPGDGELRRYHQIRPHGGGLRACGADIGEVRIDLPDMRVDLCEGDLETVRHRCVLRPSRGAVQCGRCQALQRAGSAADFSRSPLRRNRNSRPILTIGVPS